MQDMGGFPVTSSLVICLFLPLICIVFFPMAILRLFFLKIRHWAQTHLNSRQKSGHHDAKKDEQEPGITQCKGENEVECAICLCKIESGDMMRELICNHLFHNACLDKWIRGKNRRCTCPICRGSLEPESIVAETGEKEEPEEETAISCSFSLLYAPLPNSMVHTGYRLWP